MAPIGESCYLPPLDKCLDGRHQLLSWKTTFIGLSQRAEIVNDEALEKHIKDNQTIELLTNPFSPYTRPTSKSRASFETKTSAINVSPSSHGRYDIKQIQDDALWLSEETNTDEVVALRITVLEWQTRPAHRLLVYDASDDYQDYMNTVGINGLASSVSNSQLLVAPGHLRPKEDDAKFFEDSRGRRQRLLHIYLSERRYLIRTCEFIIFVALIEAFAQSSFLNGHQPKDKSPDMPAWLTEVGNQILAAWDLNGLAEDSDEHFTIYAVDALRLRFQTLQRGSGWSRDEPYWEQIEQAWEKTQVLEIIHIMQLLLTLLMTSRKLTRSDTALAWFRLMKENAFFEDFEIDLFDHGVTYSLPLRSLVALISLAVLNISAALGTVGTLLRGTSPIGGSRDSEPYLLNIAVMGEINETLIEAAAACLTISSPAVLAWSFMLQTIREDTLVHRESREIGQSILPSDRWETMDDFDNATHEKRSQKGPSISRRSTAGSETPIQSSFMEELLDRVMDTTLAEDPISYLARSALDGSHVLDVISALAIDFCSVVASDHRGKLGLFVRGMLLALIRAVMDWIDYQPALVNTVLAALTGNLRYWDILDRSPGFKDAEPATIFLGDNILMPKLYEMSLARFPYESLPFLRVAKALALSNSYSDEGLPEICALIHNVNSLTAVMPPGFSAYEIIQGDEESNYIRLTGNLTLFDDGLRDLPPHAAGLIPNSRMSATSTSVGNSQQLPSGTLGRVISESRPLVVMWQYNYSPLRYLGKILQSASMNGSFSGVSSNAAGSREVVAEIVDLLSIMMSANGPYDSESQGRYVLGEAAREILENASDGLNRNQDVVSVIFQIFENELYRRQNVSEEESSFDILLPCIQFMHALLSVLPDRVWPFLARSSLLGLGSVENQFNTLLASSDMITGRYCFLLGCIRLFDGLVEDIILRATSQRVVTTAVARFAPTGSQGSGVSRIMIGKVLNSYQQLMMNMMESPQSWKLATQGERFEINHWICSALVKVLNIGYAIDDQADASQKIAGPLNSAAEHLTNSFRSESNNGFKIYALLQILLEGTASADTTLSIRGMQYLTLQTVSALSLITTLIRVNKLLGRGPQRLDEHVFKASPILVKLYATHEAYRFPIVDLFEAAVSSAATIEQQPPSLLGHLGEVPARSFLEMLSLIDQPFRDVNLSIGVWRLLSTIISRRQQWFAIYVLTGNTPRDSLKEDKQDNISSTKNPQPTEPLLTVALDGLSNLELLKPIVTVAMLEFITCAADYWPWVLNTIEDHPHFLGAITDYIAFSEKNPPTSTDQSKKISVDYIRLQISSLIFRILAMYVSHTRKIGDSAYAKRLISNLRFLAEIAVSVPSYNASLHGNLRRNFESKFPGSTIAQFKRSTLKKPTLGTSFYYDLELATKMLSFDPAWAGRRRGHGFADELLRANINLSLVESQVNLLHSWKILSVELSQSLGPDVAYQHVMIATVIACLRSNVSSKLPENIFQGLAVSRGELAFSLLQRLFEVRSTENDLKNVLFAAWDALRDYECDIGLALSGSDADYFRLLLKILSLSLQCYTFVSSSPSRRRDGSESEDANQPPKSSASATATQVAVEIFGVVVAQGFRSLTTLLHDDPTRLLPADFALIIAISRAALHMPGIGKHIAQLLSQFSDNQTTLHASALLSWSDQISTHHDPVYAELSISFLLSLSDMPPLAESLAVEGLLTQLSSTNLISSLRQKTGVGPFDNPTRLYSIWYRGVLPLLLNLLTAVGAPIASEIACTINSFPAQLSRASNTFGIKPISSSDPTAGSITLSMALETQNLSMILKILESFREAGPSAGVVADQIIELTWDQVQVKDDLEHWMQRRAALRSRILPTNEKEKSWARLPPLSTTSEAENLLEEKLLEQMKAILALLDDNDQ